jgi:hypothetical protein
MHTAWYFWVGGGVIVSGALYLWVIVSLNIWAIEDKENA